MIKVNNCIYIFFDSQLLVKDTTVNFYHGSSPLVFLPLIPFAYFKNNERELRISTFKEEKRKI